MRATEGTESGHLVTEAEASGHPNAILREISALCGKEFESTGSFRISGAYQDGLETYLEQRAEHLCVECLNVAVGEHGWPATAEVLKRVVSHE